MTFVEGPVAVTVPATTANLGPGFDALGLALDLRDRLTAEVVPGALEVRIEGEGADGLPVDGSHLVVRAMRAAFDRLGVEAPGLRLRCENRIPHARGLGSSSAAIVGGVALARALVADGSSLLDDRAAFGLVAELEGHPDNVAAAWYGGFVVSGREGERWYAVPAGLDPRIRAVAFVPPGAVSTAAARSMLPESVPHADATATAGRAALLVVALASAPEHLHLATRDWLHQEHRRSAMPETMRLVDALRADGFAAFVSGAGPTVLVLCAEQDVAELATREPSGWAAMPLAPGGAGVRVE